MRRQSNLIWNHRMKCRKSYNYAEIEDLKTPANQTHLITDGKRFFGKYIEAKREMRKV